MVSGVEDMPKLELKLVTHVKTLSIHMPLRDQKDSLVMLLEGLFVEILDHLALLAGMVMMDKTEIMDHLGILVTQDLKDFPDQ